MDGKSLKLNLWDVSSVELDNPGVHKHIAREASGIFFVFNVNRLSSIEAVDLWRESLGRYISCRDVPFMLLAHKADLVNERIMSSDDIDAYTKVGFAMVHSTNSRLLDT